MQLCRYQFSIRLTIFYYPITNLPFCYMLRVQAFEAADRIQFVESSNHVTEAELEVQLSGYCRICSDYIFARLYGSKPQLCHCSHCIGSKPANYTCFLDVFQQIMLKHSKYSDTDVIY